MTATELKEFKVNDFITLKLEYNRTNIYVNEQLFKQCKFLLLNIPVDEIKSFDEIQSLDEAAEKLDATLEPRNGYRINKIPPEVEFWGHCSNLQTWFEYDYDTRILHRNIAFPLLKHLVEAGDPKAKRIFKEEIVHRFTKGNTNVMIFLLEEGYLNYLSWEELETVFRDNQQHWKIMLDKLRSQRSSDSVLITILELTLTYKEFDFILLFKRIHRTRMREHKKIKLFKILFGFISNIEDTSKREIVIKNLLEIEERAFMTSVISGLTNPFQSMSTLNQRLADISIKACKEIYQNLINLYTSNMQEVSPHHRALFYNYYDEKFIRWIFQSLKEFTKGVFSNAHQQDTWFQKIFEYFNMINKIKLAILSNISQAGGLLIEINLEAKFKMAFNDLVKIKNNFRKLEMEYLDEHTQKNVKEIYEY